MPRIENWQLIDNRSVRPNDISGFAISGYIVDGDRRHGDTLYEDGQKIVTRRVLNLDLSRRLATTELGIVYQLGFPMVDKVLDGVEMLTAGRDHIQHRYRSPRPDGRFTPFTPCRLCSCFSTDEIHEVASNVVPLRPIWERVQPIHRPVPPPEDPEIARLESGNG